MKRDIKKAIRMAHGLLHPYRIPPISDSHYILAPQLWELIVEIDQLQADLSGSATWGLGSSSQGLRAKTAAAARRLSAEMRYYDLSDVSDGLMSVADEIEKISARL